MSEFCECYTCQVQEVADIRNFPLKDGRTVDFVLSRCLICGRPHSHPRLAAVTALDLGDPAHVSSLREELEEIRKTTFRLHLIYFALTFLLLSGAIAAIHFVFEYVLHHS